MKYVKVGGKWVLTILLAVLMAGPGSQKFTSNTWERMFRQWGYPDGFYLVIGAVEVIGGLLLLIPRTASYSAIMLAVVMIGAAATQILRGGRNGVGELVFAGLLIVLAIIRWRDRMRFEKRVAGPVPAP
jgi:putative oxidoreductase